MPKWNSSCSKTGRERITAAYDAFIEHQGLNNFAGLKDDMNTRWKSVEIKCGNNEDPDDKECDGIDGEWDPGDIRICVTSTRRIGPVLLHEMIHECRGSELDSEAIERVVFDGNGAEPPNKEDWKKFRDDTKPFNGNKIERVADFVIWNSDTGEVWVKIERDGKVSKGDRLFQSNDWKHKYKSLPDDAV